MLQTFYVLTCNKDLTFVIRKMFWCFIKRNETAIMIRYVQWWQFQALRKIFWMVIKFAVSYTKFMQYKQSVIIYRACKFVCWSLIMNCFFCVNFRFCSTSKQWQYPPLQTMRWYIIPHSVHLLHKPDNQINKLGFNILHGWMEMWSVSLRGRVRTTTPVSGRM
jgi:hypothetical protein